jgi:hypothetical protein
MQVNALVKRLTVVVTAVMMFGSLGHAAAAAGPRGAGVPVRSGSIIGGFFVMAGDTGPDCFETPDCLVWLESDCDTSLAVKPGPALYTSIVDVAGLAGLRKQRRLGVVLSGGYGVGWGGITVQFWDAACNEINPRSLRSRRTAEAGPPALKFRIPRGAKWMTLAAWDTVRLDWTLR